MKKLKRKFILSAMISMFAVLFFMIGGLNLRNYMGLTEDADQLTRMLADNDGNFPAKSHPEKKEKPANERKSDPGKIRAEEPFQTRYFSVRYENGQDEGKVSLDHIAAIGQTQAEEYAQSIKEEVPDTGFLGIYRYRTVRDEEGILCVFVDCEKEMITMKETLVTSLCMSGAGLIAVFALVCMFSSLIFRPVEESRARQKQFITDAGHELKTPLTIIEANADVMEMEQGDSQWLQSIRNQTERMSDLVRQMILLARMDEVENAIEKQMFCLSGVLEETTELFYPVAESCERKLRVEIEENLFINGEEKSIRQMFELLFDNAVKYSLQGSEIKVCLKKKGRKIRFSIENLCEKMESGDQSILFERFYRNDVSRNSSSGGSGIGLSVVRSVAEAHQASLHAESPDGESLRIRMEFQ